MSANKIDERATYLTFNLEEESFAIEVENVREVLDLASVTKVPHTPDFMRGVINLRGNVVPVMDMRAKFGLPAVEDTVDTCIVVVEVNFGGEITVIGALADSVQEVFELGNDQIEPPPSIGTRLDTEFIRGMGKKGDRFIIILDIDKVFSVDELTLYTDTGTDSDDLDPSAPPDERVKDDQPAENAAV
jgi:purine-binding chemotaxis protein CheW